MSFSIKVDLGNNNNIFRMNFIYFFQLDKLRADYLSVLKYNFLLEQ